MSTHALAPNIAPSQNLVDLHRDLASFCEFGSRTETGSCRVERALVPVYTNEFWTSKQREGHSVHEISYRACYKPQLPDFFIRRFAAPGDTVYDPFMGRGTTLIQAQLRGCKVIGNDVNPLAKTLVYPRLVPPTLLQVKKRLAEVNLASLELTEKEGADDLLVFFHPDTLSEILAWKNYFRQRRNASLFDSIDAWIEMVACNRLTGHSRGFFSVYTLPPNQAASVQSQQKINEKRGQIPEYRNTKELILRKSRQLLADPFPKGYGDAEPLLLCGSAEWTPQIESNSVKLIVTSPPFLDTVDYLQDNWLRMWFSGASMDAGRIWQCKRLEDWLSRMQSCFTEFHRVLKNDGVIAFEVGEIRKGALPLEKEVIRAASHAQLIPECVVINSQVFTKTANCWGVKNNRDGTNTNRIVVLKKQSAPLCEFAAVRSDSRSRLNYVQRDFFA